MARWWFVLFVIQFPVCLLFGQEKALRGSLLAQPKERINEKQYVELSKDLPTKYDFEIYSMQSFGSNSLLRGSSGKIYCSVKEGKEEVKIFNKALDPEFYKNLADLMNEISQLPTLPRHPSPALDGQMTEYSGTSNKSNRVRTWNPIAAFNRSLDKVADGVIEWIQESDAIRAKELLYPVMYETEMLLVELSWEAGEPIH